MLVGSPLRMIQAVVPGMRERGDGVVVNVTSVAGRVHGSPYQGLYGASKHALGTLSESLWNEVAHRGVRVVCIEPGFFVTAITENSAEDVDPTSPYAAQALHYSLKVKHFLDISGDKLPHLVNYKHQILVRVAPQHEFYTALCQRP